ncbi:hypothetical protein Tco_1495502, partial [Tanacetum coccineum]
YKGLKTKQKQSRALYWKEHEITSPTLCSSIVVKAYALEILTERSGSRVNPWPNIRVFYPGATWPTQVVPRGDPDPT